MKGQIYESLVACEKLQLNTDDLYLSMGVGYVPDEEMLQTLSALKEEVFAICRPRYVYAFFEATPGDRTHVGVAGTCLQTGGVITPYLDGADQYVLFVATAGEEFEAFQHQVKQSGDILREFLLDAYGSAIAEAVVREVCRGIEADLLPSGWGVSHPYSPGYCGWPVVQQQALFSLLPGGRCGVRLSASSLMSPIKSVSGILAVGTQITKRKYGCELCGKKDCYKNRNR